MRKILCILISALLILVFCSCSVTFDGYSYTLNHARTSEKKYYGEYDYLFTAEKENTIVDFLINGDYLHIIKIDIRGSGSTAQYKVKSTASYLISNSLYNSETLDGYYWIQTGKYPIQVEWLVVTKKFNESHYKYDGFEFIYKDTECLLCYRIIQQ